MVSIRFGLKKVDLCGCRLKCENYENFEFRKHASKTRFPFVSEGFTIIFLSTFLKNVDLTRCRLKGRPQFVPQPSRRIGKHRFESCFCMVKLRFWVVQFIYNVKRNVSESYATLFEMNLLDLRSKKWTKSFQFDGFVWKSWLKVLWSTKIREIHVRFLEYTSDFQNRQ